MQPEEELYRVWGEWSASYACPPSLADYLLSRPDEWFPEGEPEGADKEGKRGDWPVRAESIRFGASPHPGKPVAEYADVDWEGHPWLETLEPLGDRLLVFVPEADRLPDLIPVLTALNRSVVLLCDFDTQTCGTDIPDSLNCVEFCFCDRKIYRNEWLETRFPDFFDYYNTLGCFLQLLRPEGILVAGGGDFREQIAGEWGMRRQIPTIGIQCGGSVPAALLRRNGLFRYYLVWGKRFLPVEESADTGGTTFLVTGCVREEAPQEAKRKVVLFDLLAADGCFPDSFLPEIEPIVREAVRCCRGYRIGVIEPDAGRLSDAVRSTLKAIAGVQLIPQAARKTVLRKASVLVASIPSVLEEGLFYRCIPLMYGTGTGAGGPAVTDGVGESVRTAGEFSEKLCRIVGQEEAYRRKADECRAVRFEAAGSEALRRTVRAIHRIIPCGYLLKADVPRLHIGCGPSPISGWLNVDLTEGGPVRFLDAGKPYPFPDASFQYVFSEHLFEHLTLEQGVRMLRECRRILKPEGALRLAMPNLEFLIRLYTDPEKEVHRRYIEWSVGHFDGDVKKAFSGGRYPAMFIINSFIRHWGHQMVYDPPTIVRLLENNGFKNIVFYAPGKSDREIFRNIERHGRSIPDWANELETFVVEAEPSV